MNRPYNSSRKPLFKHLHIVGHEDLASCQQCEWLEPQLHFQTTDAICRSNLKSPRYGTSAIYRYCLISIWERQ